MNRGFSLIEMVIVLMILGIMTAIAVPKYSDASDGYKLDAAEKQFRTTLNAWVDQARSTSRLHTILFDVNQDKVFLFRGAPRDVGFAKEVIDLGSAPFQVDIQSTSFVSPANQLEINGFGLFARSGTINFAKNGRGIEIALVGGGGTNASINGASTLVTVSNKVEVVDAQAVEVTP